MNMDEIQLRRLLRVLKWTRYFFMLIGGTIIIAAGLSALAILAGHPAKAIGSLAESVIFLIAATAFVLFAPRAVKRAMNEAVPSAAWRLGPRAWEIGAEYGVAPMPQSPEQPATPLPQIDLPFEAAERIAVEGRWILVEFSGCLVYTEGDLSGNLDMASRSSPPVPAEVLINHLRLRVPDHDGFLTAVAWADDDRAKSLTFSLADLAPIDVEDISAWERDMASTVTAVEIYWNDSGVQQLATVSCSQVNE
jgi:hypothetical protein